MIRAIGRFLLETWQLFYWSFFCPSLLQQRMNEWSPQKTKEGLQKDTWAFDILFSNFNFWFVSQYLLIFAIFSLPLARLVILSESKWDFLLLLAAPLISYGLGGCFLRSGIGFCSSLLLASIYWQQPNLFTESLQVLLQFLPPLMQVFTGIAIGSTTLVVTSLTVLYYLKNDFLSSAQNILWIGGGFSVLLGGWSVSQNWVLTLFLTILTIIITVALSDQLGANFVNNSFGVAFFVVAAVSISLAFGLAVVVAGIMGFRVMSFGVAGIVVFVVASAISFIVSGIAAFSVAGIVVLGVAVTDTAIVIISNNNSNENSDAENDVVELSSAIMRNLGVIISTIAAFIASVFVSAIVAISVAISVSGITTIPLPWFLITCALVSVSSAPLKRKFLGIWIAAIFLALGWENLTFNALWAIPVSLVGYYRILPDYLGACIDILTFPQPMLILFSINPVRELAQTPPYTTELLWFPVPTHDQILAATFKEDNNLGLRTLQKMQSISLPGFNLTIQKTLPLIVADRFAAVNNTTDLIDSFKPTHPLFPLIIPAFYQADEKSEDLATPKSGNAEIDILFPILQQNAKDTAAALQAGSSALRERGLERLVDKLKMLPAQLPGLGLKPKAVKRWQPAIERWQEILELEIAEQQKTSQGELLNPFQFGNPLQRDRAAIFKGRQDFADRLVRLILDRNRPTLVLHGPRRAGKTSFLLNLPRLLPSELVPIYLDMQQGSMTASEGDFCYGLVRAIDRDTRSQGLQLPPFPAAPPSPSDPTPPSKIGSILPCPNWANVVSCSTSTNLKKSALRLKTTG